MAKFTHFSAYILLILTEFVLTILPRRLALFLGYCVGLCLYRIGLRKNVILKNMRHVNLCPPSEMNSLIRNVYCTTGKYAIDFLRNGKCPPYRVHNPDILSKALQQNKGFIAILAHFGNWELLAKVFGSELSSLHVIAKSMNNVYINDWLEKKRTATCVKTIYKEQALRKIIQALAKNSAIAILIDQCDDKHGTEALFLDKPACTVKTVAGIVHKIKCPVISIYAILRDDNSYDIFINEVQPPDTENLNDDEAIKAHQNLHNEILTSWIKAHPEHYFGWFHKRFKNYLKYSEKN